MTDLPAVPTITFLGATGTVTGSKFLLSCGDRRVLVDCGLFQGLKELRLKNWDDLEIDPKGIDAIVLTHAHLDHCGYVPRIVKQGFGGKVHATTYTAKLVDVILRDSARIQVEDAEFAAKKGFSKHNPPLPLYDENDAERAIQLLAPHEFGVPAVIAPDTTVTFHPAGHILGSATVEVEFCGKRVLFTGDLGRDEHPILKAPDGVPQGRFDAIVTESTYGDRAHETPTTDFEDIINQTIDGGGSVLIPAFAVDRTEVILVQLRELMESGKIRRVPIFADSPMALKALEFYRSAIDSSAPDIRETVREEWKNRDPFDPGTLHEMFTVDESKTLNNPTSPCIIISASGMGTGGRVVHHLRSMLPNPLHTVILVGYQALGTRGRALVDGATTVKMHGRDVDVKARIEQIQSFSVHADASEIVEWLQTASVEPAAVFTVHGEAEVASTLARRISDELGWTAFAPDAGQTLPL